MKIFKRIIGFTLIASSILFSANAAGASKDDQIIYAMLMNQIQYSIMTIEHYQNKVILDKEYDNVICKIDKTKLKDENGDAIEAYANLLDTLTALKLSENEKLFINQQNEKAKKNAIYTSLNSAGAAVGMAAMAVASGNPVQAVTGLVFTGVSSVFNYRNTINTLENKKEAELFAMNQQDLQNIDYERSSLFKTYSRFITKYKIPKEYEIKEDQMKWLVETLDKQDSAAKVRLLEEKKDVFEVFTPFWYELGNACQQTGNYKKAKEYYSEFEKQKKKYSIIDNDTYYTELAKNMIQILHDEKKNGSIKTYAEIIENDKTVATENENRLYLASLYYSQGDENKAKEKLRLIIDDNREYVANARDLFEFIDNAICKDKTQADTIAAASNLVIVTKSEAVKLLNKENERQNKKQKEEAPKAEGFFGKIKKAAKDAGNAISTAVSDITNNLDTDNWIIFSYPYTKGNGYTFTLIINGANYNCENQIIGDKIYFTVPESTVKDMASFNEFTIQLAESKKYTMTLQYKYTYMTEEASKNINNALSLLKYEKDDTSVLENVNVELFASELSPLYNDSNWKRKTDTEKANIKAAKIK
ncbi:MAG: hypothetical protein K6F69_07210 [Treponema sp.]|nr:hypothetical protein [Treponema sp.]